MSAIERNRRSGASSLRETKLGLVGQFEANAQDAVRIFIGDGALRLTRAVLIGAVVVGAEAAVATFALSAVT